MNWLCWHVGTSTDAKLRLIAKRTGASLSQVVHAWAHHLERAAEGDPRGSFGAIDPDEAELATDIPPPIWMAITIAFEERGLTHEGAIVNFDKRNYGNSTLRVQAFRERQKRLKQQETLQITDETLHETEKRSCNATDRTGQTIHKNPKSGSPVHKSGTNGHNGHANGNGLGSIIKSSVRHATRASQRKLGGDEILELWAQKMFRFMQVHYSGSDAGDAWTAWNSGDDKLRDQARAIFNLASKDYDARKAAGTLQPMDGG